MRYFLPVLGILLCGLSGAFAWDPLGHMLTTAIAEQELTLKTREAVAASIARFTAKEKPDAPYDFVTAACWMDDARARTKDYNEWHYVNLPFTREGLPVPEGSRERPNLVWGINRCEAILRGEVEEPGIDRDQALMMLLHLWGDVHQPLHATDRNDAGGNKVVVTNLKDPEVDLLFSRGGNLHFFWDSAYRRKFHDGMAEVEFSAPLYARTTPVHGHMQAADLVRREAASLVAKHPKESLGGGMDGSGEDWAIESHRLGYDLAYGTLPESSPGAPVTLSDAYVGAARECAERRLVLAGLRMASTLNQLFDPPKKAN